MDLPAGVESGDPFDELHQRGAEAREVARGLRAGGDEVRRARDVGSGASGGEGARDLGAPPAGPADVMEEIDPVHVLHREARLLPLGLELVQGHEVRVRHVGEGAELVLEAVEPRRVEAAHRLQRHARPAHAVERLVDDPHPSFAEDAADLVALADTGAELGAHVEPDGGRGVVDGSIPGQAQGIPGGQSNASAGGQERVIRSGGRRRPYE